MRSEQGRVGLEDLRHVDLAANQGNRMLLHAVSFEALGPAAIDEGHACTSCSDRAPRPEAVLHNVNEPPTL
jgi:hypothetical protein